MRILLKTQKNILEKNSQEFYDENNGQFKEYVHRFFDEYKNNQKEKIFNKRIQLFDELYDTNNVEEKYRELVMDLRFSYGNSQI